MHSAVTSLGPDVNCLNLVPSSLVSHCEKPPLPATQAVVGRKWKRRQREITADGVMFLSYHIWILGTVYPASLDKDVLWCFCSFVVAALCLFWRDYW